MELGRIVIPELKSVAKATLFMLTTCGPSCDSKAPEPRPAGSPSAKEPPAAPAPPASAAQQGGRTQLPLQKIERHATAMGTRLHFIAYSNATTDAPATEAAIDAAIAEINRLESLLSEWQTSSEIGTVNARAGQWVSVGPEALEVLEKSLWAGLISEGTFDITFQSMHAIWKFGTAQDPAPRVPSAAEIARGRALIDYRKVELDAEQRRVRIPEGRAIGLGGIAKGYIVDRAADVLRRAGLRAFLVQAGGDLYGAGTKPDGSRWVSGIQDPRGPQGSFFATLELSDHAFSTAGDYARSFVAKGRRYHHILDPRTGSPATASRSVTAWAKDALTADIVDDAVFILGPQKGLALAESLDGVGVVIVDANNKVWVSQRLQGKVTLLKAPSDAL